MPTIQRFVMLYYRINTSTDINKTSSRRCPMWKDSKNKSSSKTVCETSNLPGRPCMGPATDTKSSIAFSHQLELDQDTWRYVGATLSKASKACYELVRCNCYLQKKGCVDNKCTCKIFALKCTACANVKVLADNVDLNYLYNGKLKFQHLYHDCDL